MKFRQIINIFFCILFANSCSLSKKGSKYIFPEKENVNYFIVNIHTPIDKANKHLENTFEFNNSRLIVINHSHEINPSDSFYISVNKDLRNFSPNGTKENEFKLCYFQNNENIGFSMPYNSNKYRIIPLKRYENLELKYDLFYFRVGKSCISDSIDYYDDLNQLLTFFFSQ